MRFSVLIPVYNVEKFLPKCIDGLCQQTYKDFEVILVDDGSTDLSAKLCDDFCKKNKNIKVIHKKNEGLISARREAIKNAEGEYCIFCDSDDFLEKNALQELEKIIEENNSDLILYNAYIYNNGQKELFFNNVFKEGKIDNKKNIYNKLLLEYSINAIWLKAVKRDIIDIEKDYTKFYKFNFGEDLLQTIPLVKKAEKIYYLNKALYNYRIESGMMRRYSANYYWSYRCVNLEIGQELRKENIMDFEEKLSFHLIIAAYGAVTQLKYCDTMNFEELDRIRNDSVFKKKYHILMDSKYKNNLNFKQRLIVFLLVKRFYGVLKLLLKYRK